MIPEGNTLDEIKERERIIREFYHEWKEKCKYKKETIEQEHQIGLQQIEINKKKSELANLKKSLYNENKEDF